MVVSKNYKVQTVQKKQLAFSFGCGNIQLFHLFIRIFLMREILDRNLTVQILNVREISVKERIVFL